jgi:hypothetical protein
MLPRTFVLIFTFTLNLVSSTVVADQVTEAMKECATNSDAAARLACFDSLIEADKKNESSSTPEVTSTPTFPDTPAVYSTPTVPDTPAVHSTPKIVSTPAVPGAPAVPSTPTVSSTPAVSITKVETAGNNEEQLSDAPESVTPGQNFGMERQKAVETAPESIESIVVEVIRAQYKRLTITLENGQIWRQTDSRRRTLKVGQVAVITRGAIGSFFLQAKSGGPRMRVKRIR